MSFTQDWLTTEEAAAWLGVPVSAVESAVRAGDIPALRLGGLVRISRQALLAAAGGAPPAAVNAPLPEVTPRAEYSFHPLERRTPDPMPDERVSEHTHAEELHGGGLPPPSGFVWQEELRPDDEPFTFRWPDKHLNEYRSWTGTALFGNKPHKIRVGKHIRLLEPAGEPEEEVSQDYLAVWIDSYPVCEFKDTVDHARYVSLIKLEGRRTLPPGATPPFIYRDARLVPYRDATGVHKRGVPNGMALAIAKDDLRSAVHHAAIRWLGVPRNG